MEYYAFVQHYFQAQNPYKTSVFDWAVNSHYPHHPTHAHLGLFVGMYILLLGFTMMPLKLPNLFNYIFRHHHTQGMDLKT